MKVTRLFLTFALTLIASVSFAQNIKVTGQVTDASTGEPVAFANLMVVGTTTGTATDIDGKYTINADKNASLIFSMIGYEDITVPVGGKAVVNVQMQPSTTFLEESVVSALGITRAAKSLTYSAETVKSEELTANKTANMIQALAGKAAGITITQAAGGMGGSAKINIRGYRSVSGGNQPLIIINGVPMSNGGGASGGMLGDSSGSHDNGDGIGNLNPEDIESMSILKGASASALYGTEAANGVILITTKKGSAGKVSVNFSNSTTFEKVAYTPDMQREYGEGNQYQSWGAKLSKPAEILYDNFFKTALTENNSISVQGGTEKNQTYVSYANTYANSTFDNNSKLSRHNINFRNTTNFGKKVSLDFSAQFVNQYRKNGTPVNGHYLNPYAALLTFPVGRDWTEWKENYEIYDPNRNLMVENWYKPITAQADENPWWLMNRVNRENWRNRVIASASLRYDINDKIYVQGRGGIDFISDRNEIKIHASTNPGVLYTQNGRYAFRYSNNLTAYADFLAGYKNNWGKFGLNATVGTSVRYGESNGFSADTYNGVGDLFYANIFNFNNMTKKFGSNSYWASELIGLFATVSASYNEWLFLDLTARNDWSSALAYTNSFKKGFFYPSAGVSALLNEALNMGKAIDLFKVRFSYAMVGNDLPGHITNPTGSINGDGNASPNGTAPFGELKPEISGSFEAGFDLRLLNNRINLDFTWYKTNTTNQLFNLEAPAGSAYSNYYVNSGDIENQGFEATLGFVPVETKNFTWRSTFTGSTNKNTIKKLHENMTRFLITNGDNQGIYQYLYEGGSFGDIYGRVFERDENGKLKLDERGLPYQASAYGLLGNTQAKARASWNNSFDFGNFNVSFLVDARFGGKVLSVTQEYIDGYGTSQATADARNRGYVEFEGQKFTDVQAFYNVVACTGSSYGLHEYYMYDATNIRLREASIGYSFPSKWFRKGLKGVTLAATGRNLFFFYNAAPYDTDAAIEVGDGHQGLDIMNTPTSRSFGFNLKLSF